MNHTTNEVIDDIFTYSQIINPQDYNRIMTEEHLYISAADRFLADSIKEEINNSCAHVVELGCGPGRILPLIRKTIPDAHLSAIEADEDFAQYAKSLVIDANINIIMSDVASYKFENPVNVFYSQGFHHHVSKATKTKQYLQNIYNNLVKNGIYILSDEFLPEYNDEQQREVKAIIWYSHIIAHALLHGYDYLAQEEAKTLLDDIYEGRSSHGLKNKAQIDFVLSQVTTIDTYARKQEIDLLNKAIEYFQENLEKHHNLKAAGDLTVDLSRHDYKICESVLKKEVEDVGFNIEKSKSFGPIKDIGAMSVYILRKQ
jgi:trans-aconitate methyltransferase